MRLHIAQLPHAPLTLASSHCAFTQKIRNAAKMWTRLGHHVSVYGVGGADVVCSQFVEVMSADEHLRLLGIDSYDYYKDSLDFVGSLAQHESPAYIEFNKRLRDAFATSLLPGDTLCLPFGIAHDAAYLALPQITNDSVAVIETGIGYPQPRALYRVYESEAWRHWCMGNEGREGATWQSPRLEWVVPNYYDVDEWPATYELGDEERRRVVFLGRINPTKGVGIIPKLAAARPDLSFVIRGQGDPTEFLGAPNVRYMPPITGIARAAYLGRALCSLAPSRFVEPFCGAAVESQLCGTPVIAADFGALTETVLDGVTGVRCRGNFEQWLAALDAVTHLSRRIVRTRAVARYSLDAVGTLYDRVFAELAASRALSRARSAM